MKQYEMVITAQITHILNEDEIRPNINPEKKNVR